MTAQTAEAATAAPTVAHVETTSQTAEAPKAPDAKVEAPKVEGAEVKAPDAPKPEEPKAPEAPPKADKVAAAFAGLAKKEKALVEQQRKFSAERAQLAEEKAQATKYIQSLKAEAAKADEFHKLRESARRNPAKVLEMAKALDVDYDDLSAFIMNDRAMTPDQEAKAAVEEARAEARRVSEELAAFKREQQEGMTRAQKAAAERAAKEEASLRDEFYGGAVAFVKQNVADYELILQNGAEAEVPRLIEATFEKTQKVLSVKEAADQIEDYLLGELEKVTSSPKWQRLQAAKNKPVEPTPAPTPAPVTAQKQPTTITNALTAPTKPPKSAPETEEQRVARAVAAFKKAVGK
jgi:hypothetical protein